MIFGAGKGEMKDEQGTADFGYDGAAQVLSSNLTKDDIESELLRLELLQQSEEAVETEGDGVEQLQSSIVITLLNSQQPKPALLLPNGARLILLALDSAKSDSELLEAIRLFAIVTIQSRSNLVSLDLFGNCLIMIAFTLILVSFNQIWWVIFHN